MAAGGAVRSALRPGTQRLFFALWPDERVRSELGQAARRMHRELAGRPPREESLHLTLAFLGDVDVEHLARLLTPPAGVFATAFVLTLDQWGCWARNGVGWAAPSHVPDSLRELAANVQAWLRSIGFELEHRAFKPHVTLLRKAQCGPLPEPMVPVAWSVGEFALIHSQLSPDGSRYQKLGAWPLHRKD